MKQHKIKVSIVDDHHLFRSGLAHILNASDALTVLESLEHGAALLDSLSRYQPDVVLLDLEMPVMDGLETLKVLQKDHPQIKVLLLTMHNNEALILEGMEQGACGYLLKNSKPSELVEAVQKAAETGYYFSDRVALAMLGTLGKTQKRSPAQVKGSISLTQSELELLRLVCLQHTSPEIAERLHLSPRTVESYRKQLMDKIQVRNVVGLVVYAAKHGLLEEWVKS